MFSIVKVARDQTKPGSLLARPRGRLDERPWERGWGRSKFGEGIKSGNKLKRKMESSLKKKQRMIYQARGKGVLQ